ncbi:glycosyltransferase family 92 protein At1g27200-like [Wolffia australiana]
MEKKRKLKPTQFVVQFFGVLILIFIAFQALLFSSSIRRPSGDGATAILHSLQHHQSAVAENQTATSLQSTRPVSISPETDAILFPDFEVLVLLRVNDGHPSPSDRPLCLFQEGYTSPANFSGELPSSGRVAFRCVVPNPLRGLPRILAPRVVFSDVVRYPAKELARWTFLAYESLSTRDDVIVFVKGVNRRSNRAAEDLRCVFHVPGAAPLRTRVTKSSQEVFRCAHPGAAKLGPLLDSSSRLGQGIGISLEVRGKKKAIPSVAEYRPAEKQSPDEEKSTVCACTMVLNVAKFLREWVIYHARIGVERFVLYDNGSEDGLSAVVDELNHGGYNVSAVLWPWPKTQEAGFSHCAAASKDTCRWMMFLDVDEFVFSPAWSEAAGGRLESVLPPPESRLGQLSMDCLEFGPSNRTAHPEEGVTQGYTCRRRPPERHKSVVRLEAVDPSLRNVIHHFALREGFVGAKPPTESRVVVNHYKYQAWPEFKAKFRRRASAFVADWTQEASAGSKDRTPGLGFSAVEPPDWSGRFCEVLDHRLRDLVRRWFCSPEEECRLPWETDLREG